MTTLDIIIVNWNTGGQLAACLESIVAARRDGFELLRVCVVDNASSDGSADLPTGYAGEGGFPLTIVRNPGNRGFAAACNQGAAGSGAAYLLFLNPDTRLFADSLSVPIAYMERSAKRNGRLEPRVEGRLGGERTANAGDAVQDTAGGRIDGGFTDGIATGERNGSERIGVVGVTLVGDDGEPHRACARFPAARHFFSRIFGLDLLFPRRFPSYRMTDWPHDETRIVDQVTGAFFLVRRELFETLGGFDERFFVYMEELDFARRMHDAGWRSVYLAEAAAYHRGGGASGTDRGGRLFYALRSRIVYASKHFAAPAAVTIALCTLTVEPVVRIAAALARGSAVRLRETTRGFLLLWRDAPCMVKMMIGGGRGPR